MRSFSAAGPAVVFVSKLAWDGLQGDYEMCVAAAEAAGAEVVLGEWLTESDHRRHAMQVLKDRGYRYCLIGDGDEIIEPRLLGSLIKIADAELAELVSVRMDTYWKTIDRVIRPAEQLAPLIMVDLQVVEHVAIREFKNGRRIHLSSEYGVIHHLSYAGCDERILRKITTWGHKHELIDGWFQRVWKGWDADPLLTHLHPTHPAAYHHIERIGVPELLSPIGVLDEPALEPSCRWPKISVVIPLYGGEVDIARCLESLKKVLSRLHEVIVVDDASPDSAAEVAASFNFVTSVKSEVNVGFAASCNRGFRESSGEVVLFLNSDTEVPEAGLIRLIESLMSSGTVGAAGPVSNNVAYRQRIQPTYGSIETMPLFAQDLATSQLEDIEVDLLIGFCLAVKRAVLEEVGVFDERFGAGTFEDNDLSYRMRRAGYTLLISSRAFVYHQGSKSLKRLGVHPSVLLKQNELLFREKWKQDVELGYVSHLPGQRDSPIRFAQKRKPERLQKDIEKLKRLADISLCMIVRDEERVLRSCLESALPFFSQIIVVDTGSKDQTKQIAESLGAKVIDFEWTESFSDARNESLKHATGKWIFWLDADDTLPWASGEAILNSSLTAPNEISGFIVPVQFVDEGPGAGTRVDHVKLFRNKPGVRFEGRIHEQILGSIRSVGGEIARIDAVVLHSGYDTSSDGQARKRQRDQVLLELDLSDRPNHPFVLFNLGMTCHYTGDHEGAVHWLRQCIDVSGQEESHVRKAFALLAVSQREMDLADLALATLEEGLAKVGDDAELHFQAGLLLTKLGRLQEAKDHYLAVEQNDRHFTSLDIGILGHKRLFNLGVVCMQMGDYVEAKKWWSGAIDAQPQVHSPYLALIDAALEAQDLKTARDIHERFGPVENFGTNWMKMGSRLAEAIEGREGPKQFIERSARNLPWAEEPQLALARLQLTSGREEEALPRLARCRDSGSAEAAFLLGIYNLRKGNLEAALSEFELAHQLNPEHGQTVEQISNLKALLSTGARQIQNVFPSRA